MISRSMSSLHWATLLLLSALFGSSFFFTAVAIAEIPPLTIALLRTAIAAPVLFLVLRAGGQRMPSSSAIWGGFVIMGAINSAVPISLIAWGQIQIAGGLASILAATSPLFGALAAHVFTPDEPITRYRLTGVVLGFVGVVIMIGPAMLEGLGANILAQVAVLAAALSGALGSVFGRRFGRWRVTPLATAAGQVAAAAVLLLPLSLFFERPWELAMPSLPSIAAVLSMAMLSTALAYFLFFQVLAEAGATNAQLVGYLVPVTAIVLGWLVLGEQLEVRQLLGMAVIGLGLAAMDRRILKAWSPSRPRL